MYDTLCCDRKRAKADGLMRRLLHGVEVVLKSMDFLKNKEGLHFFFIGPISAKAYIYHAMGKPMILGDNPANHELFDGDNKVTFVEMGNMLLLIGF